MGAPRKQVLVAIFAGILLCSFGPVATAGTAASTSTTGAVPAASVDAGAGTGTGAAGPGFGDLAAEAFEADRTRFEITVFENGSARWVFRYEQRLDSETAIEDFERYAERFNAEETESYRNFRNRSAALARSGREVTGRNMTAVSFDREARIEERPPAGEEFAVVEMSFVWTEFAVRDGDRLVAGDVFVGGLYVGPDQALRFERGPTLRFESVEPPADRTAAGTLAESETVTWLGERQFTDRHPRVVYVDRSDGTAPPSTPTDSPTATDTPPGTPAPADLGGIVPLVALAVVVLLGVAAAVAYRSGALPDSLGSGSDVDSGTAADTATPTPGSETEPVDRGERDAAEAAPAQPAVSDEELLSDEERVVTLLESHGGRMKQVDIVENTDWSKSKVSMLLSEMEDEGTISKLRVGRENIVSLAGHEPDAAGSPFDDGE
jgi:hypothetical protein